MEKIMIIEGMSCGHCKSSVEDALKSLDSVESVEVLLDEGRAIVKGDRLDDGSLKEAIDDIGFDVLEIK